MTTEILDRRTIGIPGPAGDASPEMIAAAQARADSAVAESLERVNIPRLVDEATGTALADMFDRFAQFRGDVSDLVVRDGAGTVRSGVFYRGGASAQLLASRTDLAVDVRSFTGAVERNGRAALAAAPGVTRVAIDRPATKSHVALVYWNPSIDGAASGRDADSPFGVVYGSAADSPSKPSLAVDGAVEIGTVTLSAAATSTRSSGVSVVTTAPYTTLVGVPIQVRSDSERDRIVAFQGLQISNLETGLIEQYYDLYHAVNNPAGAPATGWYRVSGAVGIRNRFVATKLGPAPTSTNLTAWTVPTAAYARRVIVRVGGTVGYVGMANVNCGVIIRAAGAAVIDLDDWESGTTGRVTCPVTAVWYPYARTWAVDIPAGAAVTITLGTMSSGNAHYRLTTEFAVLLPGDY